MILSDIDIQASRTAKDIVIEPFDLQCLGPNSYDVHLSKYMATYDMAKLPYNKRVGRYLDAKLHNEIRRFEITSEGFIIVPGVLYLGSTVEYTETLKHIPFLEGKSSTGRLGISIHATAGKGDIGFKNHWTFEISCIVPVKIYPGMPIAQLIYHTPTSEAVRFYATREQSKYTEIDPRPKESMMFKNKF